MTPARTRWRIASSAAAATSAAALGVALFHGGAAPQTAASPTAHPAASAQLVTVNAPRSADRPEKLQAAVRRSKALAASPATDDGPKERFRPGQIAVRFEKGTTDAERAKLRSRYDVKKFEALFGAIERWHLADRGTEAETARKVSGERGVDVALRNGIVETAAAPDDTRFSEQWHLASQPNDFGIDAIQGWAASDATVTAPVTVAVVDTGVELDHPDLVDQLWTNRGEYGPDGHGGLKQSNGRDDDFNGVKDDVHGFNAINPDLPPNPDGFHGTHVAGILAAKRNNAQGVAGVSKQARVMAVRSMDAAGGDDATLAAGFEYAISKGASIVSGSFGKAVTHPNQGLLVSIVQANPDVLFVFGAGNEGNELGSDSGYAYPCSIPSENVICVGATEASGVSARSTTWGTNFGPAEVDISAPGTGILSTSVGGGYTYASGTSMATPVVSGVAAVLKSKVPSLTPAQIRERLMRTADPIADPTASGSGRVNLLNALNDATSTRPAVGSASVYVAGGVLAYSAAAGAANGFLLERTGASSYRVTDRASALSAGAGCTATNIHVVTCTGVTAGLINTGDGADTIEAPVSIPLIVNTGDGRDAVRTGSGNDSITTGSGDVVVTAGAGRDTVTLGEGTNVVNAGDGADTVNGGIGNDRVSLGDGADVARTGAGDDAIAMGAGDDLVEAGEGDDAVSVAVSPGADRVYGQGGDDDLGAGSYDDPAVDYVDGGSGNDVLRAEKSSAEWIGGPGTDALTYDDTQEGVTAQIGTPTGNGYRDIDSISADIEALVGSRFDDNLIGSDAADVLIGSNGDDHLDGRGGDDILDEDRDYDKDTSSFGNDELIGGTGTDTADYGRAFSTATDANPSYAAITADLDGLRNDGAAGAGEADLIGADVEGVSGGPHADVLRAGATAAVLEGRGGADTLAGGPQSDSLYAQDAGADTVSCGGASDVVSRDGVDMLAADCEAASSEPRVRITGTVPEDTSTNDRRPKFTFDAGAGPDVTFTCRWVKIGSPIPAEVPCTSPVRPSADLTDGDYSFLVKAKLPTTSSHTDVALFSVDTVAPDTSVVSGGSGTVTSEQTAVTFGANETGVTYECALDTAPWRTCSPTQTFANLLDGAHTVKARAKDTAGNVDTTPVTSTFTANIPGPHTVLTSTPNSPTLATSATFAFEATPATGTTFECKLDSAAWTWCSSTRTVTGLTAGSHTFAVRGINGGVADPTPAVHTWTVDPSLPPETTVVSPPSTVNTSTVVLSATSDQPDSTFECRTMTDDFEWLAWESCASTWTLPTKAHGASLAVAIRARNAVGIADPQPWSRRFTYDLVGPQATISAGPEPGSSVADVQVEFQFSADGPEGPNVPDTFECRRDGGAWAACVSPYTWTSLAPGSHTFDVRGIDALGNVGTIVSRSFTAVAPAAPETEWVDIPATGSRFADLSPTLRFKASPSRAVRFECAAGPTTSATFGPCSSPWTVPDQTSGNTTVFQVRAIGPTGLVESTPASVTYTFDNASALVVSAPLTPAPTTSLTGSPSSLDWIHWKSATPSTVDRRDVSPARLSTYTRLGGGATSVPSSLSTTFAWTDGLGTASGSSAVGVAAGEANGRGFRFTSSAATTETRTLRVYVGVKGGAGLPTSGQLKVSFAGDTTIAPVLSTPVITAAGTTADRAFDVTFRSRLATDSLKVEWTQTFGGTNTGTAVVLYGATVR